MTDRGAARTERGLSPTAVAWLVAGACVSFLAFLATLAYQPELSAGSDRGAHALSRSPVGFAGIVRLLTADGAVVRFNRLREPGRAVGADALFVLTPRPQTSAAEIARLAKGRRILLVLPKWNVAPDPKRPGRVLEAGLNPAQLAADQATAVLADGPRDGEVTMRQERAPPPSDMRGLAWADPDRPRFDAADPKPINGLRTLSGPQARLTVIDRRGRGVVVASANRAAYVLADPDLVDNHAVADLQGARTAVAMVEGLADGGPVVFDLTLPGLAGRRSPLKLAFAPPFLPATTCLVVLAVLVGLMARGRFGAVRTGERAYGFGKRALADSAASLLAVAGREPRLAGRYAELARGAALDATGVAPRGGPEAQDAALDHIGAERGAGGWSPIAQEAKTVKTRAGLMALARRADAWRTEMTRGRG